MTAFSNGFEFESWSANWCGRCKHDTDSYCSILTNVLLDNTVPPEWSPGTDDLRDRYHCAEFAT